MSEPYLTSAIELTPMVDGAVGLAFRITNASSTPVAVRYFQPLIDVELSVYAAGSPLTLIQPHYDARAQPVALTIEPGQTIRVATPFHLCFDPLAPPSGGNFPTRWSIRHEPAPVTLRALVRLGNIRVEPCETLYDPAASG
jgi:hypothetical protein